MKDCIRNVKAADSLMKKGNFLFIQDTWNSRNREINNGITISGTVTDTEKFSNVVQNVFGKIVVDCKKLNSLIPGSIFAPKVLKIVEKGNFVVNFFIFLKKIQTKVFVQKYHPQQHRVFIKSKSVLFHNWRLFIKIF